ncbi:UNVERIFIED_CONTAM: hypothetical protein FKN15_041757 [Acipenser sinensis]
MTRDTLFLCSSLKVEYDKLANEKTEMQRHYVMYYEMSYGLNIEMHKQHQQQVAQAVERAKQVTMTELNAIIGQQQLQAQHLSHVAHGPPIQMPPHPSGLQPPGIPSVPGSGAGLLALGALGSQAHLPVKDEKNHHELDHRGVPVGPSGFLRECQTPQRLLTEKDYTGWIFHRALVRILKVILFQYLTGFRGPKIKVRT